MTLAITLDFTELLSILLLALLVFLGLRLVSMKWSYKISKPHKWDEAVKQKKVSANLQKLERTYRDKVRFYTFWLQMERIKAQKIPGAFAELGVYKGETANIMHEMNPDRKLHLFDTFDGFNAKDLKAENSDDEKYSTDNFADTTVEAVKSYIDGNENVLFYPGYFPASAQDVKDTAYAFVHLDADLYKPTLAGLQYFYPKLSAGGVIIIHDYNHTWAGAQKAIEEFVATIPEVVVEIADWQGSVMIVKCSNPF